MSSSDNGPRKRKKKAYTSDGLPTPPANFVDLIGVVIVFLKKYGVRGDGLTIAQLEKIGKDQGVEKTADEAAESRRAAEHARFRMGQAERLRVVEQEVDCLRAKYKRDSVAMEFLKDVKFTKGGRKPKQPPPPDPPPSRPKK